MRLLLDTHTFLWLVQDEPRLGNAARAAIVDGANELLLSMASCWEMAIKHAAGKLALPSPLAVFIEAALKTDRIGLLAISVTHVGRLGSLPRHPQDHRDPFDRLLVAQALAEGVPLLSRDERLDVYGVKRIW